MHRLFNFLRKPKFLVGFVVVFISLGIVSYRYLWIFDPIIAPIYDLYTGQQPVDHAKDAKKALANFPSLSFDEIATLPYGKTYGVIEPGHAPRYKTQRFIQINWFQRYRYVAGKVRIKDFLLKDRLIRNRIPIPDQAKVQYLLISPAIVEKIILLQKEMDKAGLDSDAFKVTSGFRPPVYNKQVKGKPKSRHLHGDAVDIIVFDVNRDGKINQEDENAVFQILENKIIRGGGGLGTYKSTQNLIHFDTRGYRARWRY
ncbi:MAG: DUF882 domain-containing protein [Bacteroidetes bacterium]|nr:DUF882 domain-containing protein [Bacteroidota bacterium]